MLAKAAINAICLQHEQGCNEPVCADDTEKPRKAKELTALHMQGDGHVDLSFTSSEGLAGDDETSHRSADN